jgi:DNA-binding NarL/FixJ family response regulator
LYIFKSSRIEIFYFMILVTTNDPERLEVWREAARRVSDDILEVKTFEQLRGRLASVPDALVLLDLELPSLHDGDGVEALMAEFHNARLLAFTPGCSDAEGELLVRIGVQAYLPMDAGYEHIKNALTSVGKGELWLTRHLMEYIVKHDQKTAALRRNANEDSILAGLTPRQQEVALMVTQGLTNKAIAQHLGISERTVKAHLTAIFERTSLQSRTELALSLSGHPQQRIN